MTDEPQRLPQSAIAPFALRLQPEVKAALERAAQAAGRSLNAEIAARLEQSLDGESEVEGRIATLEREMQRVWEWLSPMPGNVGSGLASRLAGRRNGTAPLPSSLQPSDYPSTEQIDAIVRALQAGDTGAALRVLANQTSEKSKPRQKAAADES